ncbi:MAG: hypothetical protein JNM68_16110 [Dinghuibacter sp.]|nr:hypothetical protein [Dinghuibacter sp.]
MTIAMRLKKNYNPGNINNRACLLFLFLLCGIALQAQRNVGEILGDPSNNYYVIRDKANAFFARVGTVGTGWKEFKRWEFLVKDNIAPNGDIPDFVTNNQRALNEFRQQNQSSQIVPDAGIANWVQLFQQDPTILAGNNQNGVGRTSSLDFAGPDIWVTTPGGGMWFGNSLGGSSYAWSAKTDGIPNLAVQDMEICPSNNNIMYALTGAVGGASGYRSTGVLKSTDAGNNWATTGLTFPESGNVKGYKLISHPTNTNIVWACTDNGLFRTADGGTNWDLVTYYNTVGGSQFDFNTNAYDIVYQPGSTTVMYATSNGPYFYKSTDGGLTFLRVDRAVAGLPTTNGRIQIGVTPANNAYVYLLYGNFATDGFQAVYRSTNSGSTFTLRSNSPASLLGSQAWRNICIAVSPTNVNDLYVGGLDVYKSTDGGAIWNQVSFSGTTSSAQFCHADIFELKCDATYLYCASDGGIYRMTRSTDSWVSLMNDMQTGQIYRLGIDPTASAAFATVGLQDNGTYRNSGVQYLNIGGADGMETIVKPSNTNVIYLSTQNGNFYRSDDGGTTNAFIRSGSGNWTTPAVLRPGFDTHIYIGYNNIDYNTTSGTGAWSSIATGFAGSISSLEFAPNNNTILYATNGSSIRRFNLSGGVWSVATPINGNLPAVNITELAVDPDNSSHVVISVGGYTAANKVFETFNANLSSPTWNNITRNLPNVPINCLVMDNDASNSIYIGTDIGVFVTNDNRVNWIMFNNGMPTTRVYDIEINYALVTNRVYAATFGRGVFYTDVYTGCNSTLNLTGSVNGLEYNESGTSITSTQFISGGAGTSVAYNSGGTVTMSPGFEAKAGVKFEAYIQGCTTSGQPPRPLRTAQPVRPAAKKAKAEPEAEPAPQNPQGGN